MGMRARLSEPKEVKKKIFHAEGPSFIWGIILTDRDYKSMPIKLHNTKAYFYISWRYIRRF